MLDVKFIVENADLVKKNVAAKNERRAEVDKVIVLYDRKKKLQQGVDEARTKINVISKDIAVLKKLGLSPRRQRTHVGFMGCHGALNGLRVARALVEADPDCRVLLCATELCSVHYHYQWDPQKFIANAIFADGSAAAVCAPAPRRNGTNGITARIQADLESVKSKINGAVKSLQEAVALNQAQRASSVSNVATQIRALASSDLGDSSALVKETDKLIGKMRAQISQFLSYFSSTS